jgi:hypothetical protein
MLKTKGKNRNCESRKQKFTSRQRHKYGKETRLRPTSARQEAEIGKVEIYLPDSGG